MRTLCAPALCALALPAAAPAAQHVAIGARFSPYRLGASAAMTLSMRVSTLGGALPSPLRSIDMSYPSDLGIATSGLGVASCTEAALEEHGPAGCPPNSIMGRGTAVARFRIGPEVFGESAAVGIVAGPSPDGRLHLLISATGLAPVAARIVMASTLLGGHFAIAVPLVPSLPGGEAVSVIAVRATLGSNLRYTERRHGRTVRYTPKGILLPRRCPRGGFRFAGRFAFQDGSSARGQTTIACPR